MQYDFGNGRNSHTKTSNVKTIGHNCMFNMMKLCVLWGFGLMVGFGFSIAYVSDIWYMFWSLFIDSFHIKYSRVAVSRSVAD